MKKLSKILKESIWSDLQDRGSGAVVRKEDDVNLLDPDGFVDYLYKHYIDSSDSIENIEESGNLYIPFCLTGPAKFSTVHAIFFEYVDDDIVYIPNGAQKQLPNLWDKLEENFDLWVDEPDYEGYTIINPKDTSRPVNNSYVLEVLDFIIDNLDDTARPSIFKRTNESIWSDLQDRSTGEVTRKEDDFNLLDDDGVLDYIKRNYTTKDFTYFPGTEPFKDINNDITIPICERRGALFCLTYIMGQYTKDPAFKSDENVILLTSSAANYILRLYKALRNNYNLDRVERIDKFSTYIKIQPKDESVPVTNSFLIEVLDFILENENDPRDNKMKKINESIWSDLQDRSSGEVKRKEDDVDLINDRKIFRDYLKKHYNEIDDSGLCEIEAGHYCDRVTVPVCWKPGVDSKTTYLSIEDFADDRYMTLSYNISDNPDIYKLLSDNYRLSILRDLGGKPDVLDIEPKDRSKVTNKLFLEVLDLLLDNIVEPLKPLVEKKKGVNESIWSDLQDRSSGDVIRKEDDFITNIRKMKPVDLGSDVPVYFADIDLEVNGDNLFEWDDVIKFLYSIEKTGWRLPLGAYKIRSIFQIDDQPPKFNDKAFTCQWIPKEKGILKSNETGEELVFFTTSEFGEDYWCADEEYVVGKNTPTLDSTNQRGFEVGNPKDYYGCFIRTNNFPKSRRCKIRLVKDK